MISDAVRARVERWYGRPATVVYPPVDVDYYVAAALGEKARQDYVLGVSRWISYKRMDLVIEAAAAVGRPAVIVGAGPERARLHALAQTVDVPVTFVESPSDDELRALYRQAAVLVFPAEEDFGIVPVEAQAAGTPVVALRRGGSLETVLPGVTGCLVDDQGAEQLAEGIEVAVSLDLTTAAARDHVRQFSVASFKRGVRGVDSAVRTSRHGDLRCLSRPVRSAD